MERLSNLIRRYHEDAAEVRALLVPAVLLWREAPVKATEELLWQTLPRFQLGAEPRDPAVFPVRKRPDGVNAFALGVTIGRAANNDIAVDHPSVSRFHAYLQLEPSGECRVFDADSSNGTLCNGVPVRRGVGALIQDGGQIGVGDVVLHFYGPASFEAICLAPAR